MAKKTVMHAVRIEEEQEQALQKRADFLNGEFPEVKASPGKLVVYIARTGIERYIDSMERLGYDQLKPEESNKTIAQLARLLEDKAYDMQMLSSEQFNKVDGLILSTESQDVVSAIIAFGANNTKSLSDIAGTTTCETLVTIIEKELFELA